MVAVRTTDRTGRRGTSTGPSIEVKAAMHLDLDGSLTSAAVDRRDDDDQHPAEPYPSAPVPPHERTWRHPSEVGEASWVHTEPPLTIGRGLLTTTAVIGGLLSLVVVWAMLPAAGDPGVTALSTVVTGSSDRAADGFVNDSVETTVDDTITGPGATVARSTPVTAATVPAATAPVSTTVPSSTIGSTPVAPATPAAALQVLIGGGTVAGGAYAVAVGDGSLVLTTAAAVGDEVSVVLLAGSGRRTHATVLLVDQRSGLAVLATDDGPVEQAVQLARHARDGDEVTVFGDEVRSTLLRVAGGHALLDGWESALWSEGSPVVDGSGDLVGLCAEVKGTMEVLLLSDVKGLRAAIDALLGGQPWLGVQLNDDPGGRLTVAAVDPDGPASLAGLRAADAIVAIDSISVADAEHLAGLVAAHLPGDRITLTVVRDGVQVDLLVVLSRRASSL